MGIKILRTSNGDKLQNTKTGKLAGSVPKKSRIPKASKTSSIRDLDKSIISKKASISQDDVSYFSQEYCDELALELNRVKGYPLYVCAKDWIRDEDYTHDDRCYGEGVTHVLVALPDGKFLDINGVQTAEEVNKNWPGTFLRQSKSCCFSSWVHPKKVNKSKVRDASKKLIELVEENSSNDVIKKLKRNFDSKLSKQPWFHSTHEILTEGTILQTGSTLGVNNFKGEGKVNNRKVWIEPKAHLALGWGSQAARHNRKKIAYIYEVTPSSIPVKKGNRGWITDSAIVIKLVATLPAIPYSLDSSKEAVEGLSKLTKVDSRPKPASKELKGALSNYVSLGEIPDHNASGTQGFRQHQAIIQEIENHGVFNTVPLYRGAARNPEDEIVDRGHVGFLSYTTDRKVAEHFVRFNSGAKLYIAPVGSVKGIQVNDYDYPLPDQAEEYGFSHHDHESEWLVINEAKPAEEDKTVEGNRITEEFPARDLRKRIRLNPFN